MTTLAPRKIDAGVRLSTAPTSAQIGAFLIVPYSIKSVRGLSEITGEDWSYIARILKTLELPQAIQNSLNQNEHPDVVKHFHLRCLLELVRLGDEEVQFARFRQMLEGARLANIFMA